MKIGQTYSVTLERVKRAKTLLTAEKAWLEDFLRKLPSRKKGGFVKIEHLRNFRPMLRKAHGIIEAKTIGLSEPQKTMFREIDKSTGIDSQTHWKTIPRIGDLKA